MNEIGSPQAQHVRKHLLTPETLARAAVIGRGADLTRHHGQGNGLRVHAVFFAMASLVALAMIISAVAFATSTA